MNADERKIFWDTLCSLSGKDGQEDVKKLRSVIKLPRLIYRYRPVSVNNLEALRTNKLYFSSSNYYDDPFDTFLHINIETVKSECLAAIQSIKDEDSFFKLKESFKGIFSEEKMSQLTLDALKNALTNGLLNDLLLNTLQLRDEVKKDTWSVCFSENGFNEVLWLKYADQYKGFALIYDLGNEDNFLCGKQEKCKECGVNKFGTPLYPIYYSDEPYDATNFAKIIISHKIEEEMKISIPKQIGDQLGNGIWERERTTLIKKKCHEYDEEWRMIVGCQMKPPIMMEWIPHGVILGLRMGKDEEKQVIDMAKEAGIKNIYKSFIDANNKLNAYPLQT